MLPIDQLIVKIKQKNSQHCYVSQRKLIYLFQDATESQTNLQDPQELTAETATETGEPLAQPPAEETPASETAADQAAQEKRRLDLKSPIELTSETIVVVGGKKCVLRVDPQTNHLMAYPFQPTPIPGEGDLFF